MKVRISWRGEPSPAMLDLKEAFVKKALAIPHTTRAWVIVGLGPGLPDRCRGKMLRHIPSVLLVTVNTSDTEQRVLETLAHELGHALHYLSEGPGVLRCHKWASELLAWYLASEMLEDIGHSIDIEHVLECLETYVRSGDFVLAPVFVEEGLVEPFERELWEWFLSIGGRSLLERYPECFYGSGLMPPEAAPPAISFRESAGGANRCASGCL